jgi:hypothetical protein
MRTACLKCGSPAVGHGPYGSRNCGSCGMAWGPERGEGEGRHALQYWIEIEDDKYGLPGGWVDVPLGSLAVFGWEAA